MVEFEVPEVDYTEYSNRQLAAVPLTVLVLALLVIGLWTATTGAPVRFGIEFSGGTEAHIATNDSPDQIRQAISAEIANIRPISGGSGTNEYIVTSQSQDTEQIRKSAQDAGYEVLSVQGRSASFGASSQWTALVGLAVAFLGMGVFIFAIFRTFVPSIAVILSAFSDIVIPVALMNLVGIQLSLGTVAALLMLIGYSVDSDILLNNHVLRRRGTFYESVHRAMQTGVTMTVTSMVAMTVMAIVSWFFAIPLLPSIGIVLVFGLAADLMNTYMMNVTLLRWYKFEGVKR